MCAHERDLMLDEDVESDAGRNGLVRLLATKERRVSEGGLVRIVRLQLADER